MYIKQDHAFLSSLLNEVKLGFMAPAPMQRDYVWERDDIEALCLSIQRGYPIGTILLWEVTDGSEITVKMPRCGPLQTEYAPRHLIMDGHNRMASLAWMMSPMQNVEDPSPAESRSWMSGDRLVFDGVTQRIRFLPPSTLEGRLWVGSECFFDQNPRLLRRRYNALHDEAHDESEIAKLFEAIDDFQKRLNNARIVVTTLVNPTPEEAKDAYMALSRAGVPFTEQELSNFKDWFSAERTLAP